MQLLTTREIKNLKTTVTAMYQALEIVEDVFCSTLDTTLVALTSKRAIAGYKAVWACCELVYLLGVICFLSLKQWLDPLSRPAIVGELVVPAPIQEPESIPDPWTTPKTVTVLVEKFVEDMGSVGEQPAIAGLLPPASPTKTPRKRSTKKDGTTTPKKSTPKRKGAVATV